MDPSFPKKPIPGGRTRAQSLLSALHSVHREQVVSDASPNHPGITPDRIGEAHGTDGGTAGSSGASQIPAGGVMAGDVRDARVSALNDALHGTNMNADHGSESIPITSSKASTVDDPAFDETPLASDEADQEAYLDNTDPELDLRKWCTGQPPKKSYLRSDTKMFDRLPITRRSTLADKPELDILIAGSKIDYGGHSFVPLTARVIHYLSPYWKGEKPIADTKVFACLLINQEINGLHADHVVAALQSIGEHCRHLLVVSPVQTSELGNVFIRDQGDIEPGNDWERLLQCFSNLEHLAYVHDAKELVDLTRGTFYTLHTAVADRQAAKALKTFKVDGPPQMITS
ncbi:hypothetical protein FB567DRAFT_182941 [Paraphoma chrysanthemicola]|uniref:Uncharacterized protein n=1 Tax=Paraphoma chrysanthemicola TaxID=798071 RepID=A0A8K0QVH7_9PLEO|nr:hypothetical protein FB567DRAFT_182941 [Paraphoma chrysanthemicola]